MCVCVSTCTHVWVCVRKMVQRFHMCMCMRTHVQTYVSVYLEDEQCFHVCICRCMCTHVQMCVSVHLEGDTVFSYVYVYVLTLANMSECVFER